MSTARRVAKNTTVLLLSRVFSMGLGIVYVAVLARYIHAAGMGKIATATSLVSILIVFVNFGFSELTVRDVAGDKARAGTYFWNALFLRGVLSVAFVVILVGVTQVTGYPRDTILIIHIYGFAYVLDALTDVALSIFNAFEKMEYPAALQLGRDIVNVVLSLGAIHFHASLITIVLMSAAACLFKLAASLAILRWQFVRPRLQIDPQLCRRLLVTAIPFATLGIISLINRQIDVVLLSFYHSEEEVGWFSAANTLITCLLLVPTMFMQAIFPVFAKFHADSPNNLQQAYLASFKYLLLLGFPVCIGTMVAADQVIAMVYGPGFENAALVLQILACLLLWMFGFANGALLNATGGQTFLAVLGGAGVVLNVVVAFLLIPPFSFWGASIAAIVSGTVFSFPITLVCYRRLGISFPYKLVFKTLVSSLLMGLVVFLSLHGGINLFVTVLAIAPVVYGVSLVVLHGIDHEDMSMLVQLFKRRTSLANAGEDVTHN